MLQHTQPSKQAISVVEITRPKLKQWEIVDLNKTFAGLTGEEKFAAYRALWRKAANYEVLTSFPLHLDIELSGKCNLRCESCFQNGLLEGPLGMMDFEVFKSIIDEGVAKGLCAIKLQIRGESFLHPRLIDCISYAKENGILDVQITTNGTLLTGDRVEALLDSGLDAIIFSVDYHHGANFNGRSESTYQKVERNIKRFLAMRKERSLQQPWVRIQASLTEKDRKCSEEHKKELDQFFPEADIIVVNRIHNFKEDEDGYVDLLENYELNPCSYIMHRLAIFWDGQVTICCSDYNNRFQLGTFPNQSIENIWLSGKLNSFRRLHAERDRHKMPICKHCIACTKAKNDGLTVYSTTQHIADQTQQ